jgi:hypothetical protein
MPNKTQKKPTFGSLRSTNLSLEERNVGPAVAAPALLQEFADGLLDQSLDRAILGLRNFQEKVELGILDRYVNADGLGLGLHRGLKLAFQIFRRMDKEKNSRVAGFGSIRY